MLSKENLFFNFHCKWTQAFIFLLFSILGVGCGGRGTVGPDSELSAKRKGITRMGYAIQVGAFSNLNNAIQLTQNLQSKGLSAYYFVHSTGLYKVRFGNQPSKKMAQGFKDNTNAIQTKMEEMLKSIPPDKRKDMIEAMKASGNS